MIISNNKIRTCLLLLAFVLMGLPSLGFYQGGSQTPALQQLDILVTDRNWQLITDQVEPGKAQAQRMMKLNVLVTDSTNQFVRDLRKDDFKITDNGVPQEVSFFSAEELPISYGLLIDTSESAKNFLPLVSDLVAMIVRENKADDRAFVMRFAGKEGVQILQDWTEDQDQLMLAIRGLKPAGHTALLDALYQAIEHVDNHGPFDSAAGRHRALIIITDGNDTSSQNSESKVINRIRELDVQIFVLRLPPGGLILQDPENDDGVQSLKRIANASGGALYLPERYGEPAIIADNLMDRIRQQYVMGYYPGNLGSKGKYHKIKVDLVKKPGQDKRAIKTRPGYSEVPK